MSECRFDTVEECLEALRRGEIVLVTDDADRENEGDCICAAEFATQANVNFMATYAKGLICMPMSDAWCRRLDLPQMVATNTDNLSVKLGFALMILNGWMSSAWIPSEAY